MKFVFLLLLVFPCLVQAQTPPVKKTVTPSGFTINGNITGLKTGSVVSLLDANSGQPITTATVTNGKFSLTGQMDFPDFRILSVDMQPPYLTVFLDNSKVVITGTSGAFDKALIAGSASHNDFTNFAKMASPYEQFFSGESVPTDEQASEAQKVISNFVNTHKTAYITALAVLRNYQVTGDEALLETEYSVLSNPIQASPIGAYIASRIAENRKFPIGKMFADFSQADTSGTLISLSSLRGKYVLVDFWASWCRPCRQENPNVVNAYNQYKNKNFTVLGVSLDQQKPAWLDAIAQDGLSWTQVSDLKGWGNEVAGQYNVKSIPQNFLIDPNGVLVGKNLRGTALNAKLQKLIK